MSHVLSYLSLCHVTVLALYQIALFHLLLLTLYLLSHVLLAGICHDVLLKFFFYIIYSAKKVVSIVQPVQKVMKQSMKAVLPAQNVKEVQGLLLLRVFVSTADTK